MGDVKEAKLILENGDEFKGFSFGAEHSVSGEVVFNTGMVGYPESLTDPSYKGQILVLTYPLIGNYGVPGKDVENNLLKNFESDKIQVQALVISDYSFEYSHWNAKKSLAEWLKEESIPAIYGIDTRKLTKTLREKGAMLGKIIINDDDVPFYNPSSIDIVKDVSIREPIVYNERPNQKKIVVVDCGVKNNIIRNLIERNLTVIRVPYDYDFFTDFFDGLLISNGPGDPKMCDKTIYNIGRAMKHNIPIFGICLGNQILALAAGGDTYKLKYGHRSQNQPCILNGTKRCFITTQNHGYAVDMKSLDENWEEFFVNANDGTNEGIKHKTKPFMSAQFHPESWPGPNDTNFLFDEFVRMLK
ncbi:glutamine-hydrolyzing carbamoyl-phosphate synthase small subunit [Candidatus Woesearchaeota archaeon]|nr:glutamine-hydrolyzing carbamoyl-phosphate synthase small subunit [Candidatus Woesearchaeota archaeon]